METKKLLIIGGVAAGATAAARARRLSEKVEITILERGPYVSFANCGLPYFISGDIDKRSKLLLQTPEGFYSRYGVKVLTETTALEIDRAGKRVKVQGPAGESWLEYDKLLLAQGGSPIMPALPGADQAGVFKLWTVPDMDAIHRYIKEKQPASAVVAGGGFIGLEMAEAFHARGMATTVVELAPQIMAPFDLEFSLAIRQRLEAAGIRVVTGLGLASIASDGKSVSLSDGSQLPAEMVLLSVGVRPELSLAKAAGLKLGESGGLLVDDGLRTSDPDIYASGDMVEVLHKVSGKKVRLPLAGPANRQGRIAATNMLGGSLKYQGVIGTSVVKILDHTAAATGLTEKAAREAGFAVGVAIVHKDHHAGYYPGAKTLSLKLVFDRKTGRLLGAQGFGEEGVDKRIDVAAMAIQGRLGLDDLAEVDLAYAPPYSSANDPLNLAAFVGQNERSGFSPLVTPDGLWQAFDPADSLILDVRNLGEFNAGHVEGALNIPVDELRYRLDELPRDKKIFIHCKVGFRGHLALRILRENGFERLWNVTGGYTSMKLLGGFREVQ